MTADPRIRSFLPPDAPFSPLQRAWLDGLFAGLFAPVAVGPQAGLATPPLTPPLTVVYASQTGTAEGLAKKLVRAARAKGLTAKAVDIERLDLAAFAGFGRVLVVASTHGEGAPPDAAIAFSRLLAEASGTPLAGVSYAVLALGDRSYTHFCGFGVHLDRRLAELGAARLTERVECDVDIDEPFALFRDRVLALLTATEMAATPAGEEEADADEPAERWSRNRPFMAPLLGQFVLNGPGSDKETRHVVLSLKGSDIAYEPGDALGMLAANDPAAVAAVLEATGLSAEAMVEMEKAGPHPLGEVLTHRLTIGKLAHATVLQFQGMAESPRLAELLEPDNVTAREAYLWGREAIDLLTEFPGVVTTPEQLVAILPRLAPRLYSISSSRRVHPDEVHLTVAAVRYESYGRRRGGVASTQLADRVGQGEVVPVYLHPNRRFRLPEDGDRPIIMIGPGTGIAPFRAFLEERQASGAKGRSWLFFGDRRAAHDYLYRNELRAFRDTGVLTRLDTAFSRDGPDKVYVQHLMLEEGAELWRWLGDGAHLYVCGDSSRMAHDVNQALIDIIARHGRMSAAKAQLELEQLTADRRYCRDVY